MNTEHPLPDFHNELSIGSGLAESVRLNPVTNLLSCVDIESGELYIRDSSGFRAVFVASYLSFAQERANGDFVLAAHRSYGLLSDGANAQWSRALISPERRFNDGTIDSAGRLVLGTMNLGESDLRNSLLIIDSSGTPHEISGDLGLSNGIGVDPESGDLIHVDTLRSVVYRRRFRPATGDYGEPEVFHQFLNGEQPDGILVTEVGEILVALWGSAEVVAIDASGDESTRFRVSPTYATSLAISNKDARLYVGGASTPRVGHNETAAPGGIWSHPTEFRSAPSFEWEPSQNLLDGLTEELTQRRD